MAAGLLTISENTEKNKLFYHPLKCTYQSDCYIYMYVLFEPSHEKTNNFGF